MSGIKNATLFFEHTTQKNKQESVKNSSNQCEIMIPFIDLVGFRTDEINKFHSENGILRFKF